MKIQVEVRNVYGTPRIYPVCDKAHAFTWLTGHKCLTRCQIGVIETLGFEVVGLPEKEDTNESN